MDVRHGNAATEARDRPNPSRLRPWVGALGYVLAQAVISLLRMSWSHLGLGLEGQGLLLVAGFAGLVVAGYRPRFFEHRSFQRLLFSPGWPMLAAAVLVAWREPYVFVQESQWLGPSTHRAALHPFFIVGLSVLLFLTALGHTVQFGSRRERRLCLDAPLLAFVGLCWVLHLRGYPVFEG